ncbi:MAG: DNA-protecting protein DprA [Candidatus Magasanikbacteria bacterium CG10_big_fil_rev_8_21_14_0_10_36_32]|uniref:DNA-protecting protein DprA n=1 Tax=Candidatus Magasanikbacteria bacterium CG10_big_fil_rev_8_21_14_0_10_36_32 TaxID=1974646 RepID=A0A2M6W6K9_9BACT|nr:MAG: DNA-protecting protein DprA [Candidatus Magasanikbacteria bacterium CG10_big_fil_rev_8_21_14_0_10_36_32]
MSSVYHAALAFFPKLSYRRYKKLAAYFINFEKVWTATSNDLIKSGLEPGFVQEFVNWRNQKPLDYYLDVLEKENITTVSLPDANYPKILKEITDPPHTLFIRGCLPNQSLPALAVVGTRKSTPYGKQICEDIVEPLAKQGMVIVSGMALGIDGIAHLTTIKAGGLTVAVLGSGVDRQSIYPATHRQLSEKIISSGGAVISEYPPGFTPTQYSFPERNRIIAGLSLGTLVIEAPIESGSLITAKCALDYNRDVLAIPHQATSIYGAGANNLLKMGARPITCAEDILDAFNLKNLSETTHNCSTLSLLPNEEKIISILSREPKHVDQIIKESFLDSATTNSSLTMLEMKGLLKNLGGMMYIKR